MKFVYFEIFLLVFCVDVIVFGQLQGPPSDDIVDNRNNLEQNDQPQASQNDRKSDESLTTPSSQSSTTEEKNAEKEEVIKILRSTDLNHEKEAQKVSEILSKLVNSYSKYIQEIDDIDDSSATSTSEENAKEDQTEELPLPELTPEELELESLYEKGMKLKNKVKGDPSAGYSIFKAAADKGHEKSKAIIAWAQLLGNPLEMNIDEAKDTFLKLSENGMAEAHMGLGFMHAAGIGFNVSQARAILHYTMAALGDDSFAQMALGYRYWSGISVASSCEKALEYYRRVATKVASKITFSGGMAVHRVRLLDEVENSGQSAGVLDNDLIEYYQLLADKGDVQAQVGLGQLHYQGGRGIPLDHQKALQYFTPAANAGNAVAMAFLGKIYLEGSENIKADNETALKYFTKAAELGNPVGQSGLGIMYLQGKGVVKDTTKAYNYFTQAADQGWVDGQLQLGNMYFSGTGVKRDFKLANKYFNLASQSGHVLAYYNLGQMHAVGLGMMRSCPNAVEFLKNVAERGEWNERLMIAHHDYKSYRFDDSFVQYALISELGYEVAQSNAAFILDRGETVLFNNRFEDLVRALQYWGRAAAQGYSAAQVKLGDYHYYGLGTQIDYDAAASHYRMASDQQHNAQAMFNLGYMHEQGLGMQKDWHLAKRSYDNAAEASADAKIPVALALLKLSFMFRLESIKDSPFKILLELDENIASNWDLYLITVLTLLLGLIIYLRGPVPEGQAPAAAAAAAAGAGIVPPPFQPAAEAAPQARAPTTPAAAPAAAAPQPDDRNNAPVDAPAAGQ